MKAYLFLALISAGILSTLLACSGGSNQRTSTCATVLSGNQITRTFSTTDTSTDVPRNTELYQIVPDQTSVQYLAGVTIGDKVVSAVVDTGSSNVIISPNDFAADPSKVVGQEFRVAYGSGGALVDKYQDSVGLNCANSSVPYTVGLIKSSNSNLPSILGLAYPGIAAPAPPQTPIQPLFYQLVNSNKGILNIFGMALCGHKTGDTIVLGGGLPTIQQSDLTYVASAYGVSVPDSQKRWYTIDARNMQVLDWVKNGNQWQPKPGAVTSLGDFPPASPTASGIPTIVDSGTTMNLFPPDIYSEAIAVLRAASAQQNLGISDAFWTANPGSGDYSRTFDAATIAKLPKFQIVARGTGVDMVTLNLFPDNYLKEVVQGQRTSSFRQTTFITILGQAFMEGYYVEFDQTNQPNRIGFASNAGICK